MRLAVATALFLTLAAVSGADAAVSAAAGEARAASSPGRDIGNAGVLDVTGAGTMAPGSDDWWVIYPAAAGSQVSVTVTDAGTAAQSCEDDIVATLWGADGNTQYVTSADVDPGSPQDVVGTSAANSRSG